MNEYVYITLHNAVAQLALETARDADNGNEADCYIEAYASVLEFLISEYEKHDPKDN